MFWISYHFSLGSFSLDHSSVLGMDIFEVHAHTRCVIAYQGTRVCLLCHHDPIQAKHLQKAEYFKVPCTERKAMPNNVQTTAQLHSSHMLKILQVRLQQYVNQELPDIQAGFRKVRGTRNEIANICWNTEKARKHPKYLFLLH